MMLAGSLVFGWIAWTVTNTPKHSPAQYVFKVVACLFIGYVVTSILLSGGFFDLSGIDPNAGQHM